MSLSVKTITKENEDFIKNSIQQMELELQPSDSNDEELVRRALFAVRNKFIYFEKYFATNSLLQITVQDVRPAKVSINFQSEKILCDCNKDGWCRHKVSALLALYQHIDSVQEWVSNWRGKKTISLDTLALNRSPDNWGRMVKEVFSHTLKPNQKIENQLLIPIMEIGLSKLMKYVPFEREWKPIYKLFMEVSALNIIWEHLDKTTPLVESNHFEQFFDKQFESISMYVEELKGQTRLFATDPFFDELQIITRTILLNRKGYEERKLKLYLTFWDKIFTEKRRSIEELKILKEDATSNVLSQPFSNIFFIMLNDIESLRLNIATIKTNELPIYFQLAKFAFSKNNSLCGEAILKAILPYLHDFIHGHLMQQKRKQFVQKIHSLYEKIILSGAEERKLFSAYGTYGLHPYSNYLIKHGRFEEWVALQQIHPSSISYIESIGLNEVLENNPAALLPLLHYYAVMEIEQKSRINYKEAAVILKKMKMACQKAGKMNFWHDYISNLQIQFKRLKAFQEELEKENVLL